MTLRNPGKRIFFAVWAVPLALWLVNINVTVVPAALRRLIPWELPPVYPGQLIGFGLAILACMEYTRMLALRFPSNGFWLGYVWLVFILLVNLFNVDFRETLSLYILLIFVAAEAFIWGRATRRRRWSRASLFLSGNLLLYVAGNALIHLYEQPFTDFFVSVDHPLGHYAGVCLVLLAVFMCDTMAYFVGSLFGRHHFSTISPNKTIEGSVAGFLASVITAAIGWYFIGKPQGMFTIGLFMGVVIGIFSITGDLLASAIKRYFAVKDASNLIPGHGGILDRFDSLFFTAPMIWLYFWVLSPLAK